MKATKFRAIIDDRDRITIPISNIKVLNKIIKKQVRDWKGSIIELSINSVLFADGKKINFDRNI